MLQALAFEAPDDLADEAAFDGVGLAEDERAVTGAQSWRRQATGPEIRLPERPSAGARLRS